MPVIDLNKLKELFLSKSPNSVFYAIRNHEYEESFPEDVTKTYQTINYGGFIVNIPANCFEPMPKSIS